MRKLVLLLMVTFIYPSIGQCDEAGSENPLNSLGSFGMTLGASSSKEYGRLLGTSIFIMPREGIGFYASYRDNGDEEGEPYYENYDLADSNDTLVSRMQEISMFSMGVTKSLTTHLGVYLGAGYAEKKGYAKMKYDNVTYPWVSAPNLNQYYYVNDEANTSSEYYLDGGMFLSYKHVLLKVGRNSITHATEYELGFLIDL